jgi:hypothetical protein
MPNACARIAFTPRVRDEQQRFGSAETTARVLSHASDDGVELRPREAAFLQARDGLYMATVLGTGWPYVQFRGGAAGFVQVIDSRTFGFADYRGSRQYIRTGNLRHDTRVSLVAVAYARRARRTLWAHARISEDRDIVDLLSGSGDRRAERGIIFSLAAFDWNCPQHIPVRLNDTERRDDEIARLRRVSRRWKAPPRRACETAPTPEPHGLASGRRMHWFPFMSRPIVRHAERNECIRACDGPGGRDDAERRRSAYRRGDGGTTPVAAR